MEKKLEWYDASKISMYRLCPRKFSYRYEQELVPLAPPSTPMQFGSAIHKALEFIYHGDPRQKENGLFKFAKVFCDSFPKELEDRFYTQEVGQELLACYLLKWTKEDFTVLAVEQPFHLEMPGIASLAGFTYAGRMDLVVRMDGKIYPWDHKTTSHFGDHFEKGFKLDVQMTGYIKANLASHPGEAAYAAVINAMRPTKTISPDCFVRKITTRSPEELVEWEDELRVTVEQIRMSRATNKWVKHAPTACFTYNRTCEYYNLCTSGESQREAITESSFERKVWEPW